MSIETGGRNPEENSEQNFSNDIAELRNLAARGDSEAFNKKIKQLSVKYHPDTHPEDSQAHDKLLIINSIRDEREKGRKAPEKLDQRDLDYFNNNYNTWTGLINRYIEVLTFEKNNNWDARGVIDSRKTVWESRFTDKGVISIMANMEKCINLGAQREHTRAYLERWNQIKSLVKTHYEVDF